MRKSFVMSMLLILLIPLFLFSCNQPTNESNKESKNYTISFDSNGGTEIADLVIEEDGKITMPVEPKKEGYTFLGWYCENELWDFANDIVKDDINLNAKWEINHYKATFIVSDDQIVEQYYSFNQLVEYIPPRRYGLEFIGWSLLVNGNIIDNYRMPTKDMIFYANWKEKEESLDLEIEGTIVVGIGNCTSNEIIIPEGITKIATAAFFGCDEIKSLEIPKSVIELGLYIFSDYNSLENILVDSSNPKYDSRDNCNAIIDTSTNSLILGCKNTIIPDSITSVSSFSFNGCIGLENIEIPESVTSIGTFAFANCTNLQSIKLPNGLTTIDDYVFLDCSSLTYINLSENIISIGRQAFANCMNLEKINIPKNVTSIGENAFYNCSNLLSITVDDENNKYDSRNNCNAIIETSSNLLLFGCGKTIIPSNVISIGSLAFYNCSNLESIEIPSSVTSIGNSAFYGCDNLKSVKIPNDVTIIESYTFAKCSSLESIEINEGVTKIGELAFYGCVSLKEVYIPNSVKIIENFAFEKCINLKRINIPINVYTLGFNAFKYCENLTIYCETKSKPSNWDEKWNPDNMPVMWGVDNIH